MTRGVPARYAVLGGGEVLTRALSFLQTIIVVKLLGTEAFGKLGFAGALTTYGVMIATCGLELYGIRAASADPARLPALASTIIGLRLLAGAIVYGLLVAIVFSIPRLRGIGPLCALAALTLFTTASSLGWTTQPLRKTHVLAAANMSTQALNVSLLLLLIRARGPRLLDVPRAQVAAEAVVAVALLAWTRARGPLPRPALGDARAILPKSLPLGGSQVLRTIAIASDPVILGLSLPMNDVGIYNGAFRLYILCVSLAALYFVILLPDLSQAAAVDHELVRRQVRRSFRLAVPLGVLGAAVAALVARPALALLFRPELAAAAPSLRILLCATILGFMAGHFRNALIAVGRQTTDLGIVAAGATAHVVLKVALVPRLGIAGAALGSAAGEAILLVLSVRAFGRSAS